MRFDLVDLRLFASVVEAGSISRGADAAHLALASASARISGMEALLGTALLERGRRGVVPTPAGRTLLHHARAILAQTERMRGDLAAFAGGLKGEIRMLSNSAALVELVPRAVRAFLAAHSQVDIEIEERTSVDIIAAVGEGRAEFGLASHSVDAGSLETRPILSDRLVLVAAADHPLAARETIGFAELLDQPFVGLSAGALHASLADQAARLGRRIGYRVRLRSFETMAGLVDAGIGLGIMPLSAALPAQSSRIAIVPLADPWADRRLSLCARRFDDLSAHARALVDELARQAATLDQTRSPLGVPR